MKLVLFYFLLFIVSCSTRVDHTAPAGPAVTAEVAECLTSTNYVTPVTIAGTASFFKRGLAITSAGNVISKITLSSPITMPLPIKFAEVQVLNSAGAVIQCGTTNSVGALKDVSGTGNLTIPNTAGSYTVQVLARAQHSMTVPAGKSAFLFYLAVKADIYSNQIYTLSQTLMSTGSGTITANSLVAYAREEQSAEVNGGAFSIYNSILTTYEYLAQNTLSSNLTCLNTKIDAFWKIGFNPAQYLQPSADPSTLDPQTFYAVGQNQLYINGGKLGEIKISDTDHFDDSVVIHELGHHMENACGKTDSPGGIHYGLYRIDPRLAWSEGWGNFFSTHIIKNNLASLNPSLTTQLAAVPASWVYYLDTAGYVDSGTGVTSGGEIVRLDLSKPGNNPESVTTTNGSRYYDKVDSTANPGEGFFRESSIARSLFKTTNSCASGCTNMNYFANIWQAFENNSSGIGMGKAQYPFRSAARLYSRLNQSFSGATPTAVDAILNTDEAQQRENNGAYTVSTWRVDVPYGIKLVVSGSACNLKIQPRANTGLDSNNYSDFRYSNHFYAIDFSMLAGVTEIWLNVSKVVGTTVDIDPVLYTESHSYDEDCAAYNASGVCTSPQKVTSSEMVRWDRTIGNGTKKLQNLAALSFAANYLLNIRAYTTNISVLPTTEYTYTLTDQGGRFLCPAATF